MPIIQDLRRQKQEDHELEIGLGIQCDSLKCVCMLALAYARTHTHTHTLFTVNIASSVCNQLLMRAYVLCTVLETQATMF